MAILTHTIDRPTPQSFFADPRHRVLVAALLVASLVPVWAATYFPSQNGPWHLLVSKMLRDYFAGASSNYFDYYELAPHPIPHLLHTVLVTLVSFVMPVVVAHKVIISLYIVLLPLSVFTFLSAVDVRRTVYGYASFLFVYNLPLMRGYHDYALGLPVVFFTLAYWLHTRDRRSVLRTAVLSALIVIAYLSHIFNFLLLGLAISLFSLYFTRSIWRTLGELVPFLPASLLVVDFGLLLLGNSVWINRSDVEVFAPHQAIDHFLQFAYTLSPAAAVIAALPFAFVVYAVARTVLSAIETFRRERKIPDGAYLLLLAVLTFAYFAMPHKFFGWHFANTRFIPFVLVASLACAAPWVGAAVRRAFVGSTAVAALAVYGLLTVQFVRADRQITEYLSGLEHFRSNSLLYPIHFQDDGIGQIQPLTRAHEYYHIFRGGANGRGIAMFNTLTPLPYRVYPVERQFPVWRPWDSDERAQRLARHYDHVLLWGTNDQFTEAITAANFKLIHARGRLRFFENGKARGARADSVSGTAQ